MAKKKNQLPSGNYRLRVYDKETGKYKSFTAPTKTEAQAMAYEWRHAKTDKLNLTVADACERYIELKRAVLSPSTIKGYIYAAKRIEEHPISRINVSDLKATNMQIFISDFAARYTPKYVKNVYGFLTASVGMFLPDASFKVTLPQKVRQSYYVPTENDVQALLNAAESTEMKLAVLFAAVGTMRRGEACAVSYDDVDYKRCTISVNKAFVQTPDFTWELKSPKTYDSCRTVLMPDYIFTMIKSLHRDEGYILNCTPDRLYVRFKRLIKSAGLHDFRYHDLRHYAASRMHAAGVPERYIETIGGWKPGSTVLKRVYENVMDEELEKNRRAFLNQNKFVV